jgi:hypothetical protein
MCDEVEGGNKPAAFWAALTSSYPGGSRPPARGASAAPWWPQNSGRRGSGHSSAPRSGSTEPGRRASLAPEGTEPARRMLARSPADNQQPAAAEAGPGALGRGAGAGGGCGARADRPAGWRGGPGPGPHSRRRRTPELLYLHCSFLSSVLSLPYTPRKSQLLGATWSTTLRSSARCGE